MTLADGSHVTLLVEAPEVREPLPPPDRRARPRAAQPAPRPGAAGGAGRRARLPLGLARRGLAVRDPNTAARPRARPRPVLRRAPAPFERGDARRNAALRSLAETLGVRTVATGDVHAHHTRRARLQDVLVAVKNRTSLEGCEPQRRGNDDSVLLSRRRSPPASRTTPAAAGRRRARRAADLRPHARARLSLPGLLGRADARRRPARGGLPARLRRALPHSPRPLRDKADQRLREEPRPHRRARPLGLLPPPLGGVGAGPRRGAQVEGRALRATCCHWAAAGAARSGRSSAT